MVTALRILQRRVRLSTLSLQRLQSTSPIPPPDAHPPMPDDPCCDPANPLAVEMSRIIAASVAIRGGVERTVCRQSRAISALTGMDVYLKMEQTQTTGSFKERGARWALMSLTQEEREAGVYAASAGNHAQALCIHGRDLGIPVTVVMPKHAPIKKIANCQQLGGRIFVQGKDLNESRALALQKSKEAGGKYINGYDHIDILAGAGTVGLEITEQLTDIDAVLVPAGGGGLLAGVATVFKCVNKNTEIIAVEADTCASFKAAMDAGKPVVTPVKSTLADGLAVPLVGCNAFESAKDKIDRLIQVPEEKIGLAILRLLELEKIVIEGAGAVGVAALISGQLDDLKGKKVVSIISGGNIDTTQLGRVLERGLAWDNRLVRFNTIVSDRPGGVKELASIVADLGASVKEINMERAWLRKDPFTVRVKVIAETRNAEHAAELEAALLERYGPEDCQFNLRPFDKPMFPQK